MRAGDEVLLQLRANTGYMDGHWAAAAAGHVEAGESVFQAAAREAREELDVEIQPVNLRPLCSMHRTHGNGQAIDERVDFFFECWNWTGQPRLVERDKTADLRWFALDHLPVDVVPHELIVLKSLSGEPLEPITTHGF
jgi:8-oxo-dGTP diphosphatase